MSEYLMRDGAPLSPAEWEVIDNTVVHVARQYLVGRKFIELAGPFGAGMETIPVGSGEARKHLPLQVIDQDFTLLWNEIESNRAAGVSMEAAPIAKAAAACAKAEDQLIFDTLFAEAGSAVKMSDWDEPGAALNDIVAATEVLVAKDFFGPYAVVLSPALYAKTQRVARGMGRMVSKLMKDVAEGGIFRSPLLKADQGLVISLGKYNLDLAVGQDLVTAYTGNEGLDHTFKVMESLAVRVKRAGAICKLGK